MFRFAFVCKYRILVRIVLPIERKDMPKKSKKRTVTLRIDSELLEAVERLSEAERRSVNNSIERILELAKDWIEAKTEKARKEVSSGFPAAA